MSNFLDKALLKDAGSEFGPWGRPAATPRRRVRASLTIRLDSAKRTLSSLRLSERAERQLLQASVDTLRLTADGKASRRAKAIAQLDCDTHRSNLTAIEAQIDLVRMAIEHLSRRARAWDLKDTHQVQSRGLYGKVEAGSFNDNLSRGYAAVRAVRSFSHTRDGAALIA